MLGAAAWTKAREVSGITISPDLTLQVKGNGGGEKAVIDSLVNKYANLFGEAARRVSKNAVADILQKMSADEIPESLR